MDSLEIPTLHVMIYITSRSTNIRNIPSKTLLLSSEYKKKENGLKQKKTLILLLTATKQTTAYISPCFKIRDGDAIKQLLWTINSLGLNF